MISIAELANEIERILSYGLVISLDIESTGFSPRTDKLVLVSLKPAGKRGVYIDCRHEKKSYLYSLLAPVFNSGASLVGHNIQFDLNWMLTYLDLPPVDVKLYDTMLAELDILGIGLSDAQKHKEQGVSLQAVAERYGFKVSKEERSWFFQLDQRPEWDQPFPQEQLDYARQDVSVLHPIMQKQMEKIAEMRLHGTVELERETIPATVSMMHWGVPIDTEIWREEVAVIRASAVQLEAEVHEAIDAHVLNARFKREQPARDSYRRWKTELDRRLLVAKTDYESIPKKERLIPNWSLIKEQTLANYYARFGKRSKPADNKDGVNLGSRFHLKDGFAGLGLLVSDVKEETLQPWSASVPVVKTYLEWKQAQTHLNKFDGDFLDRVVVNGRIYPDWQQKGAGSGRYSCKNPPMQGIPVKGSGSGLRRAIRPTPGYKFVIADFSSIELRIVAELSKSKFLLEAFRRGLDPHAFSAIIMFGVQGVPDSEIKAYTESHNAVVAGRELPKTSMRRVAKTINYMLLYGGGVRRLAGELGVQESDAKALKDLHYQYFGDAIDWLRRQRKQEFTVTMSGRRRYVPYPPPIKPPPGASAHWPETITEYEEWVELDNDRKRKLAGRELTLANHPVQGSSADITKASEARFWQVVGYDPEIRLIMSVHDELVLEVAEKTVPWAVNVLKTCMEYGQRRFLKTVAIGQVEPVVADYWMH